MARPAWLQSRPVLAGLVLLVIGACVPFFGSGYVLGLLTVAFFTAVFAMSWDLLFGFAGEVNFGPTFLIGLGAYTAGILLGMFLGVSSYSVGPLTASAFSIVVLGGLGSVTGSLIAAYVVGYLETVTAYLISPAYRFIPSLLLLVVVMYLRPQGLFGRR